MKEETILSVNIKDLDNPFEREKLKELPNWILVELLIMQLKRIGKALEYINKYPCKTWYYAKDRQLILRQEELLKILKGEDNE